MMDYWTKCVPLAWGIGMTELDSPIFGTNRCEVKAQDEGAGIFLSVEFHNEEPSEPEESKHIGFFTTHAEIDIFAAHLHACFDATRATNAD